MVRFCFRGGLWLAHDLKKCHRQPHLQGMSRAGVAIAAGLSGLGMLLAAVGSR